MLEDKAGIAVICTAAGTLVGIAAKFLLDWLRLRQDADSKAREAIRTEYLDFIDQLEGKILSNEKRVRDLEEENVRLREERAALKIQRDHDAQLIAELRARMSSLEARIAPTGPVLNTGNAG